MDDNERTTGPDSRAVNRYVGPAKAPPTTTFATAADAAKDALRRFNPKSINEGLEYGGTIYRLP